MRRVDEGEGSSVIATSHDHGHGGPEAVVAAAALAEGVHAERVGLAHDAARLLQHEDLGEHPQSHSVLERTASTTKIGLSAGQVTSRNSVPGRGAVDGGGLDDLLRDLGHAGVEVKATNGTPIHTTTSVATKKNDSWLDSHEWPS